MKSSNLRLLWTELDSPIGKIVLAGKGEMVADIRLQVNSLEAARQSIADYYSAQLTFNSDAFPRLRAELTDYFNGNLRRFKSLYCFLSGTPFQQEVWQQLGKIAHGKTTSYGRIAQSIGRPKAMRAVGQAVGSNPLPIILPCHRVLRSDGGIGGFYYGTELKSKLLKLEANAEY